MSARRSGLTLVEMMIAAAVLGLLAAVAVPRLTAPELETRTATMTASLSRMRAAVDAYWVQHDGFPGGDGHEQLIQQLCRRTHPDGQLGDGECGPYLADGELPLNPFTGTSTVRVLSGMPRDPQGTEAWLYDFRTGEVRCNVTGTSADGTAHVAR